MLTMMFRQRGNGGTSAGKWPHKDETEGLFQVLDGKLWRREVP
jgi:hypothetical protein